MSRARAEVRAEHYTAAIGLLDDLLSLDPDYRDAATLRDHAVRRRDLADIYQRAVDAQNSGDFSTALRLYTEVHDTEPDYREAVTRRQQCESAERIADCKTNCATTPTLRTGKTSLM
jgi:tetratricopeptide (TPR) repeat protein